MERTHYKQEINMTETLMNRINELVIILKTKKISFITCLHEVQDAHNDWLSMNYGQSC
jgi:NADH-quinone oxidoreductase subunit E